MSGLPMARPRRAPKTSTRARPEKEHSPRASLDEISDESLDDEDVYLDDEDIFDDERSSS